MSAKRLFIGGPWDGQALDLVNLFGREPERHECVRAPGERPGQVVIYYPREYRWATTAGAVSITVMTDKISRELGRPVLAALIKLAGIDVTWQHDPNDSG